ncbi:trafficking protein particle complex subunit 8 isoform X1 [Schistocerca americana]|uniref:trafficking protein particle complex subunit 8 isoform X1 n=1 Tax=Schistocerca americana TaxID=7009 RepID=UPI001F4F8958|nr:trafficking protein particle complex subunit 8 isoform X1 [Schistocerca americana]
MAQCKLTPHEFIQNAFSPLIAAMCSPLVDQACQKNNLSFTEMIQPFCKLNTEAHFREPSGGVIPVRNLRFTVLDVNARPPQPTLARKFLNESVSFASSERNYPINIGDQTVEIPASAPWFEAWRETFLQVQFPSDHEFTKHFLGCILVVSSAETNPLDMLVHMGQQLQQLQNVTPAKLPKWFCPDVLRYYVLLHDVSGSTSERAEAVFETMKTTYGINSCYMLQINSRVAGHKEDLSHLPDPWCQFLTRQHDSQDASDHDSSPRTPAEVGGVTGMPSCVSADVSCDSASPTEVIKSGSALEVAQEAGENSPVPVTHHPLSPDADVRDCLVVNSDEKQHNEVLSAPCHINDNVWAGHSAAGANNIVIQHGSCLSASDLERLRLFAQDFCLKSLLPFVEKQIQLLSDIISNKKGVSRSLFSATKRWFGSNKPGTPGANNPVNAVIYSTDSPELQLRRLGDLCFMFGHYTLAFQAYHSAKRDFSADQAWLYYAGALEMAALSAFMQGEPTRKAQEYMEESISTYLNSCKMPQFATRATLLSTECLKGRSLYGEAAKQFIRMTSEDSDLRSALLLEQASYCFLKSTRPRMARKYAFHIVLAGHRFSKAGQRKHSLRCYKQAYQIYENRNWSLAEDHIHFTIGRQAAYLKQISDASLSFSKLLTPASKQSAPQQSAFLREYLTIQQQLMAEERNVSDNLTVLPLPVVDNDSIKVLLGSLTSTPSSEAAIVYATGVKFEDDQSDNRRWTKLEETLVNEAQGTLPMIFRPTLQLFSNETVNTSKPIAIVREPIYVRIILKNPLHIPLPLLNVHLLWNFKNGKSEISNESSKSTKNVEIETQCIDAVVVKPDSDEEVILSVIPKCVGELNITGVAYHLTNTAIQQLPEQTTNNAPSIITIPGKQVFRVRCPRAKITKDKGSQEVNDKRLEINVVTSAPCLQVSFQNMSSQMLCGEMQNVSIRFKNIGSAPLSNLYLASSVPELISCAGYPVCDTGQGTIPEVIKISLPGGQLAPGQKHMESMWLRAPDYRGITNLEIMFYYENNNTKCIPRYRLVRHSWEITVLGSVQCTSMATNSCVASTDESSQVLNLALQVKNVNQVHDPILTEVSVSQVSLVSKTWQLCGKIAVPTGVKLQAQESIHFVFSARRQKHKKERADPFSDLPIEDHVENVTSARESPYVDFYNRHRARVISSSGADETAEVSRNSVASQLENDDTTGMEEALNINATLILRWQTEIRNGKGTKRMALGQHHLILDKIAVLSVSSADDAKVPVPSEIEGPLRIFGPDDSSYKSVTSEKYPTLDVLQRLVIHNIRHSPKVCHDFSVSRLCFVPVQLQLQNCSDTSLVVRVNASDSGSSSSSKNKLYSPHSSSTFHWVGLAGSCSELSPHDSTSVSLCAVTTGPGTFDLGSSLEVWCRARGAPEADSVAQVWHVESALVVDNTPVVPVSDTKIV